MPRVIVAGGTGFLGRALLVALQRDGFTPVVLTRGPDRIEKAVEYVSWDARSAGAWVKHLDGATAIVNYVGRSVDCRKTAANRKEILESRINSVNAIGQAMRSVANPPRVWVQQSTAHIYGDTGDEILDEASPFGTGLAPEVGQAWERAVMSFDLPYTRRILLRTSFVLGRGGGAMSKLGALARWGLGGTVGSGRQYISWIHVEDVNAIVLRAINDEFMTGVYVVTAPNPVTNKKFMEELRRAVRRPWSPPAPAMFVRIGSRILNTDPELALLGRRCIPKRLLREGFRFRYPELPLALSELYSVLQSSDPAPTTRE